MHSLSLIDRLDQKVFDAIYSRSLVYNTCWEDPGHSMPVSCEERLAKVPYLPGMRVPYYLYIGRKPGA